jgi:hypothetical protein
LHYFHPIVTTKPLINHINPPVYSRSALLACDSMDEALPMLKGDVTLQLYDVGRLVELAEGVGAGGVTQEGIGELRRHARVEIGE